MARTVANVSPVRVSRYDAPQWGHGSDGTTVVVQVLAMGHKCWMG